MLLGLAIALIALSVMCGVLFLGEIAPGSRSALASRLAELQGADAETRELVRRRRRQARAERLAAMLQALGERVESRHADRSGLRLRLVQAGYPGAAAPAIYLGARMALPVGLAIASAALLQLLGASALAGLGGMLWFGAVGYVLPAFYLGSRIRARQKQMQKALPDALDLLVVCVEAGLGLNQALVRVAEEVQRLSPVLSEQMALVNLEIRAGTPREDAFRSLGERTGLDDIKSLAAMLIQTDRFGTSIAQALRVQADTLRTKRRQRAEEAAAKTTIKLVFPLVLFIFPAMFVVILGSALIQIFEALANVR